MDAILLPYCAHTLLAGSASNTNQALTAAGVWDLPQSHTLAILYPECCRTGPILLTDIGRVWHGYV